MTSACSGQLPEPTTQHLDRAQAKWPGISVADLQEGRRLTVQNCASCHPVPRPSDHPSDHWPEIMDRMTPLVKMTPDESNKIEQYLVLMAEFQRAAYR